MGYEMVRDHWKERQYFWKGTTIQVECKKTALLQALRKWTVKWPNINKRKILMKETKKFAILLTLMLWAKDCIKITEGKTVSVKR